MLAANQTNWAAQTAQGMQCPSLFSEYFFDLPCIVQQNDNKIMDLNYIWHSIEKVIRIALSIIKIQF